MLPSTAAAKEIVVLLDPTVKPYVEVLAGLKAKADARIKVFERTEDSDESDEIDLIPAIKARKPDLILAVGTEAMRVVAGRVTDIPIVFCMVLSPEDKLTSWPKNLTGISMNVSPARQMKVLSTLLPDLKHVAVVYHSDQSSSLIEQGKKAARAVNKQMVAKSAKTSKEAVEQAEKLLDQYQAYWMIPDQMMRSRDVVRYLFFAAREKNRALIGLSDKYVRAGALFAFTVDNIAVGHQAADIANRILSGKGMPEQRLELLQGVDLSINMKVAEKLGISVPYELIKQAKVIY